VTRPRPEDRPTATAAPGLVEHSFRREYGRLVAILARRVGVRHLDIVEDAVQDAMLAALTSWTAQGVPDDPGAWLYRVAYNSLIDDLRRKTGRLRILAQAVDPPVAREMRAVRRGRLARHAPGGAPDWRGA
jgi:RNA polymerase sigma factor (sigma-70 family)